MRSVRRFHSDYHLPREMKKVANHVYDGSRRYSTKQNDAFRTVDPIPDGNGIEVALEQIHAVTRNSLRLNPPPARSRFA